MRGQRQIAVQPPIVGDYCSKPGCRWCETEVECPRCHARYCRSDYLWHMARLVVPPDSWRSVRRRFRATQAAYIQRFGQDAYNALPFFVGSYCKTPSGRRATAACAYESKACTDTHSVCLRCKFPYCSKHLRGHVVRFSMPRRVLLAIHNQYRRQLDELADRKRPALRIRVPSIRSKPWQS